MCPIHLCFFKRNFSESLRRIYIEMSKIDLAILSLISFYLSCLKIEMKFDHEMVFFYRLDGFKIYLYPLIAERFFWKIYINSGYMDSTRIVVVLLAV